MGTLGGSGTRQILFSAEKHACGTIGFTAAGKIAFHGARFFLNFEKGNWKFGNLLSVAQLWHGCSTAAVWYLKISKIEEVNAKLGTGKHRTPKMGIRGASALARFYFRQKNMRAARLASRRPEKLFFTGRVFLEF